MNPINGKIAVAVCGTLFIVEMLTASAISLVFAEDSSRDAAEPLVVLKSADVLSVAEIVSEDSYDADEIYKMGLELCESHMTEDILVRDWENPEIIDFKLLHSFETGYVRYALYEISYDDGHFASFIYDIEDGVCEQFGDGNPYSRYLRNTLTLVRLHVCQMNCLRASITISVMQCHTVTA